MHTKFLSSMINPSRKTKNIKIILKFNLFAFVKNSLQYFQDLFYIFLFLINPLLRDTDNN